MSGQDLVVEYLEVDVDDLYELRAQLEMLLNYVPGGAGNNQWSATVPTPALSGEKLRAAIRQNAFDALAITAQMLNTDLSGVPECDKKSYVVEQKVREAEMEDYEAEAAEANFCIRHDLCPECGLPNAAHSH